MNTIRMTSLALAASAALTLSACSGGDDTKAAAPSSTSATMTKNVTPAQSPSSSATTSFDPAALPAGKVTLGQVTPDNAPTLCERAFGGADTLVTTMGYQATASRPKIKAQGWTDGWLSQKQATSGSMLKTGLATIDGTGLTCQAQYIKSDKTTGNIQIQATRNSYLHNDTSYVTTKPHGDLTITVKGVDSMAGINQPFTAAQKSGAAKLATMLDGQLA